MPMTPSPGTSLQLTKENLKQQFCPQFKNQSNFQNELFAQTLNGRNSLFFKQKPLPQILE